MRLFRLIFELLVALASDRTQSLELKYVATTVPMTDLNPRSAASILAKIPCSHQALQCVTLVLFVEFPLSLLLLLLYPLNLAILPPPSRIMIPETVVPRLFGRSGFIVVVAGRLHQGPARKEKG
jgi:hypothetical protein